MSCPEGSFQNEEGQVSCMVCPENTSTKSGQAKSSVDCKGNDILKFCAYSSFYFIFQPIISESKIKFLLSKLFDN